MRIKVTIPKSFLKEHSDALYVFEYLWWNTLKNVASEVQKALQSFDITNKIAKYTTYILWYDDYGVKVSSVKDNFLMIHTQIFTICIRTLSILLITRIYIVN